MIGRDLVQQAFPNQPRMQAAFAALVADAEDATDRLNKAIAAIGTLADGAEGIVAQLAQKQPKNDTLSAVAQLPIDPGVIEQIQPGIIAIRAIDTADTASLVTRALGDSRWLGGAHGAASAAKLTTARSISITGDMTWSVTFDGSANVSAAGTLATVNATTGSFGSATQSLTIATNAKGLITNIAAQTITPAFSSITGKPTTLAGYGITDAQGLNANLTAISGLTTAADKLSYWTGSGTAALISFPAAARTAIATLTGTNTGDQTITLTGDATGSGTGSFAVTLATVNTNTGSWGSATQVAQITLDGKGRATAAANVTITPAVGSITGLGTGVATALAVNVGSAGAFVTFNGAGGTPSSLTLTNATGLPVAGGGTGIASYAVGDILYASASTTLSKLADVATGNVLISGGVTTAPAWGKVTLTTHVSGVLPTANGGTNTDVGTGWTPYTPTITPNAGTFTTISVQGRWKQMGKIVFLHITIFITTNGTASGYFTITAPTSAVGVSTPVTNFQALSCNQNPSGFQGRATLQSGTTTIFVTKYDGTFLGGDGQSIHITGMYEAA